MTPFPAPADGRCDCCMLPYLAGDKVRREGKYLVLVQHETAMREHLERQRK